MEGLHKVKVPKSPVSVMVEGHAGDASKVTASGPGLEPTGVKTGKPTYFDIFTKDAGRGQVEVIISDPEGNHNTVPCTPRKIAEAVFHCDYVAQTTGMHSVNVFFSGQQIPKSPFGVNVTPVCDARKVKATGRGLQATGIRVCDVADFKIFTENAGDGQLDIKVTGPGDSPVNVDTNYVHENMHECAYHPLQEGCYRVEILYGGQEIPGSPYKVNVGLYKTTKIRAYGPGLYGGVVQYPACFRVDSNGETGSLGFSIEGPSQARIERKDNGDGSTVKYFPTAPGEYSVHILCDDEDIPKSPYLAQILPKTDYFPEKVEAYGPGLRKIGVEHENPTEFTVDVRKAGGPAQLEINAFDENYKPIAVEVIENTNGTYLCKYTPLFSIFISCYTIEINYGGVAITNSPFKVRVGDPDAACEIEKCVKPMVSRASSSGKKGAGLYEGILPPEMFTLTSSEVHTTACEHIWSTATRGQFKAVEIPNVVVPRTGGKLTAEIKMPSGKMAIPVVIDNLDGTFTIKYLPREEGLHVMDVKYNQENIPGSPFKSQIDAVQYDYAAAYGPGLKCGVPGKPCYFTIFTKDARAGEGRKRSQISVGHSSEVSLEVTEKDYSNLKASIVAPSGVEEPCLLKALPNGQLGILRMPLEAGGHLVNVKRLGNHIQGSPFKMNVADHEIGDASKVKVSGTGLEKGKTHMANEFTIDTQEAGCGALILSIEGPSETGIQCKDNENGTVAASYTPTEPGYYIVNLKFADHHVPGSPFTVKVAGLDSNTWHEFNKKTLPIMKQRQTLPIMEVGSECKLTFKMPGSSAFDMTACVNSPSGVIENVLTYDLDDCIYCVPFMPQEDGLHTVRVCCKDIPILGSPFQFMVGNFRDHGAHSVHAVGPGLIRGQVKEPCEFSVWTEKAGTGSLTVDVRRHARDPDDKTARTKPDIDFKDNTDGSCNVSYVVKEPGDYRVGIKFNGKHIPDSPFHVSIMPQEGDATNITLRCIPDSGVQVNKPLTLSIMMNGAKGILDGKVIAPSGTEDDCFIAPLDEDQWGLRFIPLENGTHLIHIRCNGIHIPESPFHLHIGVDEDPAAVSAYGQGLKEAKSGTLGVTIDGPSKVPLDCTKVEEGYKVKYTPLAPGDYNVTIQYNGYDIDGSPFKVPCIGDAVSAVAGIQQSVVEIQTQQKAHHGQFHSDVDKVTSEGMGLKKAHLNQLNHFTVDCSNAGNKSLTCTVHGPNGECNVDIEKADSNLHQIFYSVKVCGEHSITVKWGDKDIPGSPFNVDAS